MNAQKYIDGNPVIRSIANKEETVWINPYFLPFAMTDATCQLVVSDADSGVLCFYGLNDGL